MAQLPGEIIINDTSRYNGIGDPVTHKTEAHGVIMQATYGNKGIDGLFEANAPVFMEAGVPIGTYHVLKGDRDPIKQAEHFYHVVMDVLGQIPPLGIWMDVELRPVWVTKTRLESVTYKTLQHAQLLFSVWCGIYTGAWFWDPNMPRNDWAKDYYLWPAHWPYAYEYSQVPVASMFPHIPADWRDRNASNKCVIWQYEADRNLKGKLCGFESRDIDYGRFMWEGRMGTMAEFNGFFGANLQPPTPPQPPSPETLLMRISASPYLNVRTAPWGTITGRLLSGELVLVSNVGGNRGAWIEIASGEYGGMWACVQLNDFRYMEPV